jgi:precorrin-2 dehydrogenase/sirohydrochlorin ferrochelatase
MDSFPAFFPLVGRTVVIAGEGEAAEAKARLFAGGPAVVRRLAGETAMDSGAYAGASLVFIAGGDEAFVRAAHAAARGVGAPVNVVDYPQLCDFMTPAIIDRGPVVAALGTSGAAPVLASMLRAEMETRLAPGVGELARLLAQKRAAIRAAYPDLTRRRGFFRRVLAGGAAKAADLGDVALASRLIDQAIADAAWREGRVDILEAPQEGDRLSLRAVRALGAADVVVMGEGSGEIIERHARRDAERWASATPLELARGAKSGLRLAVVDAAPDRDLLMGVRALGATADLLAPAP